MKTREQKPWGWSQVTRTLKKIRRLIHQELELWAQANGSYSLPERLTERLDQFTCPHQRDLYFQCLQKIIAPLREYQQLWDSVAIAKNPANAVTAQARRVAYNQRLDWFHRLHKRFGLPADTRLEIIVDNLLDS